ncbi:MAG: HEAT repeat protein [Myxococcota bacterium]|jgi:HEAT repeat protein
MRKRTPHFLAGIAALALITTPILVSGCFDKGDPNSCEYWMEKAQKTAAIEKAIEELGRLQCKQSIPLLTTLYKDGQFQERILQSVREIGDKAAALPLVQEGLQSKRQGKLAAAIATEWKLAGTEPQLRNILMNEGMVDLREVALKALLTFKKPGEVEDVLTSIAGYDANAQGYLANHEAIRALGEIRSAASVPTLMKMAYLRTNKQFEVYTAVREAFAKIGDTVTPALLDVLAEKNEAVKSFVRDNGVKDWEWRLGPKTAQLLADTLDPTVVPALVQSMKVKLATPSDVRGAAEDKWRTAQSNRLKITMLGLGRIGTDAGVPQLQAMIQDTGLSAISQRINAATALATIGTPQAQEALFAAFRAENHPTSPQFRPPLVQVISMGIDHTNLEAFNALVKDGSEGFKKAMNSNSRLAAYLSVPRACGSDVACYLKKLEDKNQDVRVKAALILMRELFPADEALMNALFQTFKTNATPAQLDTRMFTLAAIIRRGGKAEGEKLLSIADAVKESDPFWFAELTIVGNWMVHRAGRKATPAPTPAPATP